MSNVPLHCDWKQICDRSFNNVVNAVVETLQSPRHNKSLRVCHKGDCQVGRIRNTGGIKMAGLLEAGGIKMAATG